MRTRLFRSLIGAALSLFCLACLPDPAAAQVGDAGRFQHEVHAAFKCAECHSTGAATTVSNRTWCADCHHVNAQYSQCQRCHTAAEISPEPVRALLTFHLPPDVERTRSLVFDHTVHGGVGCGSCHTGGAVLRSQAGCASCHTEHHKPDVQCTACHSEPPVGAHTEAVHLDLAGCGASGCHVAEGVVYARMFDDRNFCISCHVGQVEHEQPAPCAECHKLGETAGSEGGNP